MFKSFFPKPGPFFISAFIWSLLAVIFWQAGGGDWLLRVTGASQNVAISAARFWSLNYLVFYAYYLFCVGVFALFWFVYCPHRWQYWSILGTSLIIFVTWFLVEVGVAINAWYAPFYDLIQSALATPHKVSINQFYQEIGVFLGIAIIAVIIGVMNNFFVSHYVFRWRTAMNEHYMAHWQHLRHIEGAAQLLDAKQRRRGARVAHPARCGRGRRCRRRRHRVLRTGRRQPGRGQLRRRKLPALRLARRAGIARGLVPRAGRGRSRARWRGPARRPPWPRPSGRGPGALRTSGRGR